ncbi:MAG: isoprenyl transferase [Candidatus Gastranaerophilales bacterium]|nr:isoprenyl transferase [Candidatus Gastranaerophilales bacterium]
MIINNESLLNPIQEIIKKCRLNHIAIIMDGNRRWAKKHKLPSTSGHNAGVKSLKNAVKTCGEIGIDYLTVYAFSTENWGRKKEEVDFLMFLLGETVKKELKSLHNNNVRIRIIGNLTTLNKELQKILRNAIETTSDNTGLNLQIAINYGSREEICNAVSLIASDIKAGKINPQDICDELISDYLYTADIPDPDLLIRTGGEQRLSNYLLWQSAYTEIYITNTYWPDFGKSELEKAVHEFVRRDRRFGRD